MLCKRCNRQLKENSKFCDFCGTSVDFDIENKKSLNKNILVKWIFISITATILLSFIFSLVGLNLFFAGIFLPFFWIKNKKSEQK